MNSIKTVWEKEKDHLLAIVFIVGIITWLFIRR